MSTDFEVESAEMALARFHADFTFPNVRCKLRHLAAGRRSYLRMGKSIGLPAGRVITLENPRLPGPQR